MANHNLTRLTPSEKAVVRAILAGHTTADELHAHMRNLHDPTQTMAKRTIQSHMSRIYSKTGARNKAELILMAQGTKRCMIDLVGQMFMQTGRKIGAGKEAGAR